MDITALILAQATDLFRLGLLAGLIYTTDRTRRDTGVLLPLAAGVIFIAVIIPATMPKPDVSLWLATATGLGVNAVLAGLFWLGWQAVSARKG